VWHDAFICVTWLVHVYDLTQGSFIRVTRLIHTCNMTPSYVWHASFICVTWFIHMYDVTYSYVWYDSFICDIPLPPLHLAHVYTHTHIHIHIQIYTYTYIYIHIGTSSICTHTDIYINTSIYTYIHIVTQSTTLSFLSDIPLLPLRPARVLAYAKKRRRRQLLQRYLVCSSVASVRLCQATAHQKYMYIPIHTTNTVASVCLYTSRIRHGPLIS